MRRRARRRPRRRTGGDAGHDHRVRALERLEAVRGDDREAADDAERARPLRAERELVPPGDVELGPRQREHLGRDAQLERREALEGEAGDAMGAHVAIVAVEVVCVTGVEPGAPAD